MRMNSSRPSELDMIPSMTSPKAALGVSHDPSNERVRNGTHGGVPISPLGSVLAEQIEP